MLQRRFWLNFVFEIFKKEIRMKKSIFICVALAFMSCLTSCLKDPENHELYIAYPNGISIHFADQTRDSVAFYTFDNWKIRSNTDWLTLTSDTEYNGISYDPNKRYYSMAYLEVANNKTGKARIGTLSVTSYEYTCAAMYYQYPFLQIVRPSGLIHSYYPNSNNTLPDSVSFTLCDSANWTLDSLSFTVEKNWTIDFVDEKPTWVNLSKQEGRGGNNKVDVNLEVNPTFDDRSTKIRLTSSEITNEITLVQFGQVKKQEEE